MLVFFYEKKNFRCTYKASSEFRPVNACVGTCSNRFPSKRRLFKFVNNAKETLFIVEIEFPDNCL